MRLVFDFISCVDVVCLTEYWGNLALKSGPILGIALLLILHMRRSTAAARHWVLCLAFYNLLLLSLLPIVVPGFSLPLLPQASLAMLGTDNLPQSQLIGQYSENRQGYEAKDTGSRQNKSSTSDGLSEKNPNHTTIFPRSTSLIDRINSWPTVLVLVWLSGMVFLILRLLAGVGYAHWFARYKSERAEDEWENILRMCSRQLRIKRKVQLLQNRDTAIPMTFGGWRPVIILPQQATNWSQKYLKIVLLHELAHVKRWDYFNILVEQFICAIYWYNPLVWTAARRLQIEREKACDDRVIYHGTEMYDYARCLLDIVRDIPSGRRSGLRVLAMATHRELKSRLESILERSRSRHPLRKKHAILIAVITIIFALFISAMQVEEKDSQAVQRQETSNLTPNTLAGLLNSLENADPNARKKAAWRLGNAISSRGLQPLIAALNDTDPEVRLMAAWALGEIGDQRAVSPLINCLADADPYLREMAIRSLGYIKSQQAISALAKVLRDPDEDIRSAAVVSLGEIGTQQSIEALGRALHDRSPGVREMAVCMLGYTNSPRAIEKLKVSLGDENPSVRAKAAHSLGLIKDASTIEKLVMTMKDSDPEVRQQAAEALGKMKRSRAIPALISALRDEDPSVRSTATWALNEIKHSE